MANVRFKLYSVVSCVGIGGERLIPSSREYKGGKRERDRETGRESKWESKRNADGRQHGRPSRVEYSVQ